MNPLFPTPSKNKLWLRQGWQVSYPAVDQRTKGEKKTAIAHSHLFIKIRFGFNTEHLVCGRHVPKMNWAYTIPWIQNDNIYSSMKIESSKSVIVR